LLRLSTTFTAAARSTRPITRSAPPGWLFRRAHATTATWTFSATAFYHSATPPPPAYRPRSAYRRRAHRSSNILHSRLYHLLDGSSASALTFAPHLSAHHHAISFSTAGLTEPRARADGWRRTSSAHTFLGRGDRCWLPPFFPPYHTCLGFCTPKHTGSPAPFCRLIPHLGRFVLLDYNHLCTRCPTHTAHAHTRPPGLPLVL